MKEALYAATGALDFIVTTVTEFHFEHAELFVEYPVQFTFSCNHAKQTNHTPIIGSVQSFNPSRKRIV